MFSRQASRPARKLIALIVGITAVSLATLLWLGRRLLDQDRLLEAQQAQQRVERAADLTVAALQRALAASEERLVAGAQDWPDGAVAIVFHKGGVDAHPARRIAWLPAAKALPEAPAAAFAAADDLEFHKRDPAAAVALLRGMAASADPAFRAAALLRLARNLRHIGSVDEALASYSQMSAVEGVLTGGAPAPLAAQYARCKLLEETGRRDRLQVEARRLHQDLREGRWPLSAPVYWLYSEEARRWTGDSAGAGPSETFAAAAALLWERWTSTPPGRPEASGRESLVIGGESLSVLWRASNGAFRALIASPAFVEAHWLPAAAPVTRVHEVALSVRGLRDSAGAPRAKRTAVEAGLPWDVFVSGLGPAGAGSGFVLRRRLLIAGFLLLVAMGVMASYLAARAINRELAVGRMQSDFVAAVSHEFRTPLTTLRQFTDMLREHAHLPEDRRRLCYDAQSRATERLTHLVESLLDFGRMEAGARPYRFERRECAGLVSRVVEDFRGEAQAGGYDIRFHGNGPASIQADGEALARAVWNLLDNAVKYSPERSPIEVGLCRRDATVAISVRDRGIGVAPHEQAAIFTRFHRGEEARARGIRGTGIGLAMVDHIVKAHRGRVEVESEPGQGSTFTILLPLKERDDGANSDR